MNPIKVDVAGKLSGDITKPCCDLSQMVVDDNGSVRRLMKLLLGEKCVKRLQEIKLQEAQDDVNAQAIREGKKVYANGEVFDLADGVFGANALQYVSIKNQVEDTKRLVLAVQETVKKLKSMPEKKEPVESVSTTFFNRWRKEVEMVDDAQLRDVWTSILAHEVAKPRSVSLRTLDVARNLSNEDAKVFQKMIQGQVENCIPKGDDGHVQYASFDEVLQMQDAGLLQTADFATVSSGRFCTMDDGRKRQIFMLEASEHVVCADEDFQLSCYPLTKAGLEISHLAIQERSETVAIEIAKFLDRCTKKGDVALHKMLQGIGRKAAFQKRPIWTSEPSSSVK